MTADSALLELVHVSRYFGGVRALEDVTMRVQPGTIHGLIGPNGAGKTTLVNVLAGFYRPTSGAILLNGARVDGRRTYQVARMGVARTYQNIRLFGTLSALDNVLVARREHTLLRSFGRLALLPSASKSEERERKVGLGLLERLGVDGEDPRPAGALAYGNQRRVEIARALACEPRLLVLDEPTAGMNRAETDELGAVLRALLEPDTAILLIEHDLPLIMSVCDTITVLNFGRVIAVGGPAEIAANAAVVEAYLGREDDAAAL